MAEVQSLTALRGIAAMWIVLFHFWPQTSTPTPHLIAKGYLAVDLFFILSGMVLWLVYGKALQRGQFSFRAFVRKRFARLYPVHLITMLMAVTLLTLGPELGFEGRPLLYDLTQMIVLHLGLLHAWGLTETGGLNYPSWSLSAEAFAYLLFPALALFLLHSSKWLAVICAAIFLISAYSATALLWPDQSFTRLENDYGTLRIMPEFLLGMCLANLRTRIKATASLCAGIALISVGLVTSLDLICVLGFAALLTGCCSSNLRVPAAMRTLGVISYSLYMIHALVQIAGFKLIEVTFGYSDGEVPLIWIVPLLLLTLTAASALYHWVERPARAWLLRQPHDAGCPTPAQRSGTM